MIGFFEGVRPDGSGRAAGIQGIVTGIVKENWDDKHQGMVKVEYSLGGGRKKCQRLDAGDEPLCGKGIWSLYSAGGGGRSGCGLSAWRPELSCYAWHFMEQNEHDSEGNGE